MCLAGALDCLPCLLQTCKKVKDNEENCARAQQRAAVLVPLLSKIYQRVSLDPKVMCAAISHAVSGIAEELNAQVRTSFFFMSDCTGAILYWCHFGF